MFRGSARESPRRAGGLVRRIRRLQQGYGAIAQLGERLHGMQEVGGSIPPGSTSLRCFASYGSASHGPVYRSENKRNLPRRSPKGGPGLGKPKGLCSVSGGYPP